MLELENRARHAAGMQPKALHEWDEILLNHDIELPLPPMAEEPLEIGMLPEETRYTMSEVLESFFVMVMENYRNLGFPQLNFVMLPRGKSLNNSAERAAMMVSDAKFKNLAKMVDGKFRYLKGKPKIDNLLEQRLDDVLDMIETETAENTP